MRAEPFALCIRCNAFGEMAQQRGIKSTASTPSHNVDAFVSMKKHRFCVFQGIRITIVFQLDDFALLNDSPDNIIQAMSRIKRALAL